MLLCMGNFSSRFSNSDFFFISFGCFLFFFFFHCSARSEARARGRYQLDGMGYKRQEMLPYPLIVCLPVSMMRV